MERITINHCRIALKQYCKTANLQYVAPEDDKMKNGKLPEGLRIEKSGRWYRVNNENHSDHFYQGYLTLRELRTAIMAAESAIDRIKRSEAEYAKRDALINADDIISRYLSTGELNENKFRDVLNQIRALGNL